MAFGFAHGFALPLRGLRLSLAVPALRRWTLILVAVTAISLLAVGIALIWLVPDLLARLWARPEGWLLIPWYGLAFVLYALGMVLGAATVPAIVTSPLADPLVAATERHLGLRGPEGGGLGQVAGETLAGLVKAVLRVAILLAGHLVLLPLWLLPGAGHATWTVLSTTWTVFWLVFEYLDIPANRFGWRFGQVARAIQLRPSVAAGFGTATWLLLWVPLLNTLFIPAATVGATLLFHELQTRQVRPVDAPARSC